MKVGSNGSLIYEYLNGAAREKVDYETSVIGKTLQEVNSKEVIATLYKNYQYSEGYKIISPIDIEKPV